jgi:hypothetical protein
MNSESQSTSTLSQIPFGPEALLPASFPQRPSRPGKGSGLWRGCALALLALLVPAGAPAAAQDRFYPELTRRLRPEATPVDFLFVVDRSGSMRPHWPGVQRALEEFIRTNVGERVAVMGFDENAYDLVTSTGISAAARADMIRQLRLAGPPRGRFTNIVAAVEAACDWLRLRDLERHASIVFISDGEHEPSGHHDPSGDRAVGERCRQMAATRGVVFLAIGIPPGIEFAKFRELLPDDRHKYREVTAGVGELMRQLGVLKLSVLVGQEHARARSHHAWVRIDSVRPSSREDAQGALLQPGDSAWVFATVTSPYRHLAACPRAGGARTDDPGFSGGEFGMQAPRCLEPEESLTVAFPLRAAAAETAWQRVIQRLRPRVMSDHQPIFGLHLSIEPEPRNELEALAEFPDEPFVLAQQLGLPVQVSDGIPVVVHALLLSGIVLLGMWRVPARLHGQLTISDAADREVSTVPLTGKAKHIELEGGLAIALYAEKRHPLSPFPSQSNLYVEGVNGTSVHRETHRPARSDSGRIQLVPNRPLIAHSALRSGDDAAQPLVKLKFKL